MLVTEALTKGSSRKTKRTKLRQAMTKQLVGENTTDKGRGLVALADFAAGEVVAPLDGTHTWGGVELTQSEPEEYTFVCDMLGGKFRKTDPDLASVGWHLCNHSCTPNARLSVVLVSTRRIAKGDEITVHYGWHDVRAANMKCLCGSPNCYGTVGPRVHGLKGGQEEVLAWRAYLDSLIANKNVQGVIAFQGLFNKDSFRMIIGDNARGQQFDQVAARSPEFYDYELPVDRILSLSF